MTSSEPAPVARADRSVSGEGHTLLCTDTFVAEYGGRLAQAAPGIATAVLDQSGEVPEAALERVTMAFMSKDAWPNQAAPFIGALRCTSKLEWFHVMSAGTDGPIFDELQARGVRVTRSAGASANAMAETVFMFLHGLARDLRGAERRHADREFEWHSWAQLEGRRVAVLGYGPVGQRVVELAMAYGMAPTIVRRAVRGDEPCPTRTLADLDRVAADNDVMVVALPHTPETEGVVSRTVIDHMPPSTLFVNVARGALVDQGALTEALEAGRLGGAGLDVFAVEPLPETDPLWDLPNVLITPHNSGSSHGSPKKVIELFFTNLDHFLRGQAMRHEV